MTNRPIKFRAFDLRPGKRCMIDNVQDGSDLRSQSFGQYLAYPNTYAVMQFTGLKDKNDEEIYEGDIIKTFDHYTGEVYYINGGYFVTLVGYGDHLSDILEETGVEVIGNIHETPEYLKTK